MKFRMAKRMYVLHLLIALAFLLSACTGGGAPGQGPAKPAEKSKPKYGGELRITRVGNLSFLDPQRTTTGIENMFTWIYAAYLMEVSEDGQLQPGLAESWSFPDPKTIVLKLRPGVKFHDGTDVDSAAVKFSIERAKDAKTASPFRSEIVGIAAVDTPDPLTVKLQLTDANASLLYTLRGGAGPLVSPTAVKKWGDEFERNVVSAGPFALEKYTPEVEVVFKRFENYFGKDADGNSLPYLDRIRIKIIPDATVAVAALESGETDLDPGISADYIDRVQANRDLVVVTVEQAMTNFMHLNTAREPISNPDLRKALAYAVDQNEIVKSVYGGRATPARAAITPSMWAFDKNIQGYSYDPTKAKEYLAKAGHPNGLKLKGATISSFKNLAEAVQGQLRRLNIEMTLDVLDTVAYRNKVGGGEYDVAFIGTPYRSDPDRTFVNSYSSSGYLNAGKPNVPEMDRLIEQGRAAYDVNERKKIYRQLLQLINDRVHNVFIADSHKYMAHRSYVKGLTLGSEQFGDVRWIWLDK